MIKVEGLTKRYGASLALRGVSFEVPQGEIFGFVGPNGAGKTTTIRILATLLRPSAGAAVVAGVDLGLRPDLARKRLGYMPDFFGVYDRLTVTEYLLFYAGCYRVPTARRAKVIGDLLELVGLPQRRDDLVDTLSRGMKQRLCLARTLIHDPAVLLLDEPASGLDPRARVEMRALLQELKSMGKTILISSHILPELTDLCTMIGIIDHGQMRATGPVRDVVRSLTPGRRLRIEVLDRSAEALALVQTMPQVQGAELSDGAIRVRYEGDDARAAEVLQRLVSAGFEVSAFGKVEGGLEDAFLHATSEDDAA